MKELTENQIACIELLHQKECGWIASATERAWQAGESYYLDSRVIKSGEVWRTIVRRFKQGNQEAKNGG